MSRRPTPMDHHTAHRESVRILVLRGRFGCFSNKEAMAEAQKACDVIHNILCKLRDGKVA